MVQVSGIAFVTMVLVQFLDAVERSSVTFPRYDPQMGQGGCKGLFPLLSVAGRCVYHYGFASFVFGCAFDSARVYLLYCRLAKLDRSSKDGTHRWFLKIFADARVHYLIEAFVTSRKNDESGAHGADRPYAARAIM